MSDSCQKSVDRFLSTFFFFGIFKNLEKTVDRFLSTFLCRLTALTFSIFYKNVDRLSTDICLQKMSTVCRQSVDRNTVLTFSIFYKSADRLSTIVDTFMKNWKSMDSLSIEIFWQKSVDSFFQNLLNFLKIPRKKSVDILSDFCRQISGSYQT